MIPMVYAFTFDPAYPVLGMVPSTFARDQWIYPTSYVHIYGKTYIPLKIECRLMRYVYIVDTATQQYVAHSGFLWIKTRSWQIPAYWDGNTYLTAQFDEHLTLTNLKWHFPEAQPYGWEGMKWGALYEVKWYINNQFQIMSDFKLTTHSES